MKRPPPYGFGIRPASQTSQPLPSFNTRNSFPGSQILSAAGTVDLLNPKAACTVQWALVQTSVACTLQLLQDGDPIGAAIDVNAKAVVRFSGRLLPNNAKLSLSVSAASIITFEVAWVKDFCPELMELATQVSYGSIQQQKKTFIETTTLLGANGVYTGPWHDSDLDGSVYAIITSFSNVAGATGTFQIQLSDDNTDANFSFNSTVGALSPPAGQKMQYPCYLRARFWRVLYTNGATPQATFKIVYTTFNYWIGTFNTGQSAAGQEGALAVLPANNAGAGTGDNDTLPGTTLGIASGSTGGAQTNVKFFGGKFSATADLVRQGWSMGRTPTVFRQAAISAVNTTALWTPGAGNKFRLLKYRIIVNASAIMAAATDLTISLLDAALGIAQVYVVRIPAAALASGVNFDSQWVDLGKFGILSAAANNVLNGNLSAALTGGTINIMVAGTEE